ncbi:hypothetical protein PanWU01x14_013350 [Parasponia andersonii]|uniref:Uncharacterized protein n=1 Tax=Parasponia andersonii TaxID=3476 RepID=A0A2P5E106_PARAD|nr:hypothetical protein PanWU01x14_013350 [Parasponia andersonii]
MLHRFGIVIAMPGLIPACLAKGESKTAHRHLGALLIKAPTLAQQAGGTLAPALPAALRHGLRLAAADLIGVIPHSPAASTSQRKAFETSKNISTKQALMLEAIVCKLRPLGFLLAK